MKPHPPTWGPPSGGPFRFLFVMQYPGYMRYFDTVVHGLAARGHHVDVVFDLPEKQAEGAEAVAVMSGLAGRVELPGRTPSRGDVWAVVGRAVRATIDYVRYLHPTYASSPYLRDRMRLALPPISAVLGWFTTTGVWFVRAVTAVFTTCERAIPSSPVLESFIRSRNPDVVLVTPIVTDGSPQVDVIKSAQALGIPSAVCVASWDHLTTKGLIRVRPELVSVWNEHQRGEAVEYHAADPSRILVTGATPFDRWFERRPTDRRALCEKVGLRVDRPIVLFVGSTASISSPEAELSFVRQWIEALRREPGLSDAGILIRPHPYNAAHWRTADMSDLKGVAIYPRFANPVNEADRQDYYDSLYHSEAVVGVNTTAMIEAAIVGRTVHTVLAEDFKDTQGGTLHFRYLLAENGGFLRVATSLSEHARQVAETVQAPGIGREACARFVAAFIRPRGIDAPATPVLVDAIEQLAASGARPPVGVPLQLYPLQFALWTAGLVAVYKDPARLGRVAWRVRKQAAKFVRELQKRRERVRKQRRREKKLAAVNRETNAG